LGNKGHEDGQETSLSHLRGSASIAQLSDIVVGLERDQQAEGVDSDTTILRVLKNRHSGLTGVGGTLKYDKETGRLSEAGESEYFPKEDSNATEDY
jgi:twinkle protein